MDKYQEKALNISFFLNESNYREVEVSCPVIQFLSLDPNYGADIDGRRGMPVWFLEEIDFREEDITITHESNSGTHTINFKNLKPKNQKRIKDMIEKEAERA